MRNVALIISLFLCLASCSAQKEKLGLNLTKGNVYNQTMNADFTVNQTYNGQQMTIKMGISGKMEYKVTDSSDSVYSMEVSYKSLTMKVNLPTGSMEFSSEKAGEPDIFSSILASMKDKAFLIKMTKTGKIKEVKNIDALFANMFDKFPQITEEQKQQIKQQIMQAYGEKAFKGNIEEFSAIFPDDAVAKGDKWKIKTQLESGMSAKVETEYELKEVTDSYYQIAGNSVIESENKDAYIQANAMPLKYDIKGTMVSDVKVDKKTGWVTEAKISQSISGSATIKPNAQMAEGMTIPITMSNEMTITGK